MKLIEISDALSEDLQGLRFASPVAHVYNPLEYAREPHREYLERYGGGRPEVLFVGMNPGPWGMAQTGVPFGAVPMVRDWMGIDAPVGKPPNEHPKRRVEGFACARVEVSGDRVWGWARDTFGAPERFFARFFIGNYCPLQFLNDRGTNITPDKLSAAERAAVEGPCDLALRRVAETLRPRRVIGVGVFAEQQARRVLEGLGLPIDRILHPSPASPIANRGWAAAASRQLRELGIELP